MVPGGFPHRGSVIQSFDVPFLLAATNCGKVIDHFNSMSVLRYIIWKFKAIRVKKTKKNLLITHFENLALSMGTDVHRDFDTLGCVSRHFLCRYLKIISDAPNKADKCVPSLYKTSRLFISNLELLCENGLFCFNWMRKHEICGTYGLIYMTDISQGAPTPVDRFLDLAASCISLWAIFPFWRT